MTVEKALEVWKKHMDYSSNWIKRDPHNWKTIIDQAYGFTIGMQTAVDGLWEEISGGEKDLWSEWYMTNHPAYKK